MNNLEAKEVIDGLLLSARLMAEKVRDLQAQTLALRIENERLKRELESQEAETEREPLMEMDDDEIVAVELPSDMSEIEFLEGELGLDAECRGEILHQLYQNERFKNGEDPEISDEYNWVTAWALYYSALGSLYEESQVRSSGVE